MTETDLRTLLNNLEASRASLHGWLHFWTLLVVVGVALEVISLVWEYIKELNDFKRGEIHAPEKPSLLLFTIGFLGIALVVAGVSGELYVDVKAETIETGIRKANDDLLALISKEADDAKTSAKGAADAASRANVQAGLAKDKADAVAKLAAEAARNLAFTQAVVSARYVADPKTLADQLSQFKGDAVTLQSYAGDKEGEGLCSSLAAVTRSAEMIPTYECGMMFASGSLITEISVSGPDIQKTLTIGGLISRTGRLGVASGINGPRLTIFVGVKSPFVIGPTWQTRAADALRKKQNKNKGAKQ